MAIRVVAQTAARLGQNPVGYTECMKGYKSEKSRGRQIPARSGLLGLDIAEQKKKLPGQDEECPVWRSLRFFNTSEAQASSMARIGSCIQWRI